MFFPGPRIYVRMRACKRELIHTYLCPYIHLYIYACIDITCVQLLMKHAIKPTSSSGGAVLHAGWTLIRSRTEELRLIAEVSLDDDGRQSPVFDAHSGI